MNDGIIETLLNEDESESLDFKKEQYRFVKAADDAKSELLKDIIAFANSWRRDTAYILVGVEEVKGGRSIPHGVSEHLDDASIQQFVNAKLNRPLQFRYFAYDFQSASIAIIEIPRQSRPFYLKADFGKLKGGSVYIRRSSSTDVSLPDEIARMGHEQVTFAEVPVVALSMGNYRERIVVGKSAILRPRVLVPPATVSEVARWCQKHHQRAGFMMSIGGPFEDEDFPAELLEHVTFWNLVTLVDFQVENQSGTPVTHLRISGRIPKVSGLLIADHSQRPRRPKRSVLPVPHHLSEATVLPSEVFVSEAPTEYEVTFAFERLLPGEKAWTDRPLYAGCSHSAAVDCAFSMLADQFRKPVEVELQLEFQAEDYKMHPDDWKAHAAKFE